MVSFRRNSHDFERLFMAFGTPFEIKRKKDKSRESGSSGQGKQSWEVERNATI